MCACGVTVDKMVIVPGGYCSEHRHAMKTNLFIVDSGELEIRCWPPGGAAPESKVLRPGLSGLVPPGVWHQFRSSTGAHVTEICFIAVTGTHLDFDIERRTKGGRG
jgi:mannose-6-phosphate isomerase-like protein (cupin superfamily)